MAADAEKTVEYPFITNSGSTLFTATTLATSPRYNFPDIGITIPEKTSRNFKSVILECNWRDSFATVYNVVGWRLGISTGSNAYNDMDFIPTAMANTGDHEAGVVLRDVTDYFNQNFGTAASTSARVGFAMATATSASVQNITAKLIITYEFDSTSASRLVNTVRIPIQSASALLGLQQVEIGATGAGSASGSQVPALDTFLPESNKLYKARWFEMFSNDNGAATTLFTASYAINSQTSVSRCLLQQALNTGCYFYDIWMTQYTDASGTIQTPYNVSASQASVFYVNSNLVNRFDNFGGLYCVTYEYDKASTSVMNSLILPIDTNPGYIGGVSASNSNYFQRDIWIEEPNPITLAQSGVLFYAQSGAGDTLYISPCTVSGCTAARPCTLTANAATSGGHVLVHRINNFLGNPLTRGKNTINIKAFSGTLGNTNSIVGLLYLNYTSSSSLQGIVNHNHTTIWHLASQATGGAQFTINEILSGSPYLRGPTINNPNYFLNGVAYELGSRFGTVTNGISLHAEKQVGEYNGDGWKNLDTWIHTNDGELATYHQIAATLDSWNQDSNHIGEMNIEATRTYRIHYSTAAMFWLKMYLTYHNQIFSVSGSFTNYSGTGANVVVDVYRYTDDYWSGSALSSTTGSYSVNIFDSAYPVFAVATQDAAHIGRSASALAV